MAYKKETFIFDASYLFQQHLIAVLVVELERRFRIVEEFLSDF